MSPVICLGDGRQGLVETVSITHICVLFFVLVMDAWVWLRQSVLLTFVSFSLSW